MLRPKNTADNARAQSFFAEVSGRVRPTSRKTRKRKQLLLSQVYPGLVVVAKGTKRSNLLHEYCN